MKLVNRFGLPFPSKLFKYKSDYGHLEDLFKTSELFFASPELLNDPFDMRFHIDNDAFQQITSPKQKHIQERFTPSQLENLEQIQSALLSVEYVKNEFSEMYYNVINDAHRNNIAVFCMSKKSDDKLLWGYYANGYKGYCIEFDFKHEISKQSNFVDRICKVDYSLKGNMIPYSQFRNSTKPESNYLPFILKNKAWKHEKEYRAIILCSKRSNYKKFKINKQTIKSVTFGFKVDDSQIDKTINLANENGFQHVKFYCLELTNSGMIKNEI